MIGILLLILLILILLLILLVLFAMIASRVRFVGRSSLCDLLQTHSEFYQRFTSDDLAARKVKSVDDYLSQIQPDCSAFTVMEKLRLVMCTWMADRRFSRSRREWLNGKEIAQMKWQIACMTGTRYEAGLPHTVRDTIILFREGISDISNENLVQLLMHEKTHLYQKRNPEAVRRYLDYFRIRLTPRDKKDENFRTNPDTTDQIYEKMGVVYGFPYRPSPQSITDLARGDKFSHEHPLEEMAYQAESV